MIRHATICLALLASATAASSTAVADDEITPVRLRLTVSAEEYDPIAGGAGKLIVTCQNRLDEPVTIQLGLHANGHHCGIDPAKTAKITIPAKKTLTVFEATLDELFYEGSEANDATPRKYGWSWFLRSSPPGPLRKQGTREFVKEVRIHAEATVKTGSQVWQSELIPVWIKPSLPKK